MKPIVTAVIICTPKILASKKIKIKILCNFKTKEFYFSYQIPA